MHHDKTIVDEKGHIVHDHVIVDVEGNLVSNIKMKENHRLVDYVHAKSQKVNNRNVCLLKPEYRDNEWVETATPDELNEFFPIIINNITNNINNVVDNIHSGELSNKELEKMILETQAALVNIITTLIIK